MGKIVLHASPEGGIPILSMSRDRHFPLTTAAAEADVTFLLLSKSWSFLGDLWFAVASGFKLHVVWSTSSLHPTCCELVGSWTYFCSFSVVQITLRVHNAHFAILNHLHVLVALQQLPPHNRCTLCAKCHSIVITEFSILNSLMLDEKIYLGGQM